ncbi:MAG: hypothetical protein AAF193_03975, partial [Bacteroidota bacterium]
MRQILKCFMLVVLSQFLVSMAFTQELSDLSNGMLKKTATGSMRVGDVHTAIEVYSELHNRNPNQIKYLEQLENLNVRIHNYQAALDALEQIAALNDNDVLLEYRRAEYQKQLGEYAKAKTSYQKFVNAVNRNAQLKPWKKLAQRSMAGCDSALLWIEKQDNIEIQRLSEEVNGPHIEFNPIQISQSQLIYGALKEDSIKKFHQDSLTPKRTFYKAINQEGEWLNKGVWKEELLDSLQDVGNGCFSSDSSKFFFSKCARSWKGEVICKIWMAEIAGNGDLINLRELNEEINAPGSSNSQPTIGKETRRGYDILYFVSNRDGGRGGQDIWAAVYDERKKQFRAPKNIGRKINSEFDDVTPFFDQKTKKLYFSSTRPEGMGGLDVYSSRGEYRRWVDPNNLGFPINSNADELYYIVGDDPAKGYFSSNRLGTNQMFHPTCCDDIFSYDVRDYVSIAVQGVVVEVPDSVYVNGLSDPQLMKSLEDYPILENSEMEVFIIENGEEVLMESFELDSTGRYEILLEPEQKYRIQVTKAGYLNNYFALSTIGQTYSDTIQADIGLAAMS